ncbi:YraN family protein [Alcanivorax sp. 1008]|uniref:YraN family protein n=1 Tax=Alcanivorax sp. 1008 TaxID=2816853 RepID=UPI001D68B1DD|nr:YraN family protein [Alcanivorax sp. 1008]MCC1495259.1 YraN family protein [Alcanivorax sp. 1008]
MDVLPTSSRQQRGEQTEKLAESWLNQQGLYTVTRNWRCRMGEIDLIMLEEDVLVFVEVRFRSSTHHGGAAGSVDPRKQRRLVAAARHYLRMRPEAAMRRCRFDVIAMQPGSRNEMSFDWIAGAFYAE